MKKFLLVILLGCLSTAFAQLVQVSGFIWARGDSTTGIPFVNILNKRTLKGTQTNYEGFYTILMAPGDSVEVSYVGYATVRLGLPSWYTGATLKKNLFLTPTVIQLNTAHITDITWDKFKEAFAAVEIPEKKKYVTLDPNISTNSAPVRTTLGYTIKGPLTWLYNKVGKKAKELNKLDELKSGDNYAMATASRVTEDFVMEVTGLPKEQVQAFLAYCQADDQFYARASEYEMRDHFSKCLPGFKQMNTIHPAPSDSSSVRDSLPK